MRDMQEKFYRDPQCLEVPHRYAHLNLHILADLAMYHLLARMSALSTNPLEFRDLMRLLYTMYMGHVMSRELYTRDGRMTTRMCPVLTEIGFDPSCALLQSNALFDDTVPCVSVGIARAGNLPSSVCFEVLSRIVGWGHMRLDVMSGERRPSETGPGVEGTTIAGIKVGGSVEGAVVLFPDPMCATGGSLVEAIHSYLAAAEGTPRKVIAMPLIITPEAVRRLARELPYVTVYALRLDRGVSPLEVFDMIPGADRRESGLTPTHYIVPGLGGAGELLSNAEH